MHRKGPSRANSDVSEYAGRDQRMPSTNSRSGKGCHPTFDEKRWHADCFCCCIKLRHAAHILTLHGVDYRVKTGQGFSGTFSTWMPSIHMIMNKVSCVVRKRLF